MLAGNANQLYLQSHETKILFISLFYLLERITSSLLKLHKRQRQNINYIHHSAVWGEWHTFQFYFPIHCYACLDLLLLSFVPICGICYSHHRSHPSADPERYFLEKQFTHMPCFYYLPHFSCCCSSLFLAVSNFLFVSFFCFCFVVLVCFVVVFGGSFTRVLETLYCRVNGWMSRYGLGELLGLLGDCTRKFQLPKIVRIDGLDKRQRLAGTVRHQQRLTNCCPYCGQTI